MLALLSSFELFITFEPIIKVIFWNFLTLSMLLDSSLPYLSNEVLFFWMGSQLTYQPNNFRSSLLFFFRFLFILKKIQTSFLCFCKNKFSWLLIPRFVLFKSTKLCLASKSYYFWIRKIVLAHLEDGWSHFLATNKKFSNNNNNTNSSSKKFWDWHLILWAPCLVHKNNHCM